MEVYMKIIINNWEKFNPRKDLKSMPWFRLNADIGYSETLFGLSAEQKWLWIFLLSTCARKMSAEIDVNLDYMQHNTGIKQNIIEKTIQLFEIRGLVRDTTESDRNTNESVPYITNRTNRTEQYTPSGDGSGGGPMGDEYKANVIGENWNIFAQEVGLSKVKLPLGKDRVKKIIPALKEFPEADDWINIIGQIEDDPFRLGKNDRGWKANFDWLFHTTKFNYRNLWEEYASSSNCENNKQ